MENLPVEQIIKAQPPKSSYAWKGAMIVACILAATTIPTMYAVGVILLAILVVATIIVFRYFNAEYEYSLVDNELTIDKIMSRSMRRRCGVYQIAKTTVFAKTGSQAALRMEYQKLRTADYTANEGKENVAVLYTLNQQNELVRIFIEPNEKMVEAFRKVMNKDAFQYE